MKKIIKEFQEFAIRGNAFELAVGVVIGSAFNQLIASFVQNIISPFISLLLPNTLFSSWTVLLKDGSTPITLNIGTFLETILSFIITTFSIFIVVKFINKLRTLTQTKEKVAEEAEKLETKEIVLLGNILEELKKNNTK